MENKYSLTNFPTIDEHLPTSWVVHRKWRSCYRVDSIWKKYAANPETMFCRKRSCNGK